MSTSKLRAKFGVERFPHLGIRHSKRIVGFVDGSWVVQFPTEAARVKLKLPPNRPFEIGANETKRSRAQRLAHRRRFSGRDRMLPREEA